MGGAPNVLNKVSVWGGGGEGKSLWDLVMAFEEVDLQKWEIHERGFKGRGFLRIWDVLLGN